MMAVACAGPDEDRGPVPFVLKIQDRTFSTLLEISFDDYGDARDTGPYSVLVMEDGNAAELEVDIKLCEMLTMGCAGPLTTQRANLSLRPIYPENIASLYCEGLDGAISRGFPDGSRYGNCK
jgi:hypothetical protein